MASADRIEAAAARWISRQDAAPLEAHEQAEFEAWCARDPRHLGAFVRLEAINARLQRAVALQGLESRAAIGRGWWLPAAAAAALMVVSLGTWQLLSVAPSQEETRALATGIGEQYRATLRDGSLVELNTATQVAVELDSAERRVTLSSGEAVFDVAKDPDRPFIVKTEFGEVRAVGTIFSVRLDGGLDVLVSEGAVLVNRDGQHLTRVNAGERYAIGVSGEARRTTEAPEAISRSLVWREGKVAFAGETLAEAAREFNRYNRLKIEIVDPAVGSLRFGGYFRATDPEGFTTALEQALPVDARRAGNTISLSAR